MEKLCNVVVVWETMVSFVLLDTYICFYVLDFGSCWRVMVDELCVSS